MEQELYHHGILGQKWGVRRFQNPDGSLTEEGKRRYGLVRDTISGAQSALNSSKNAYESFSKLKKSKSIDLSSMSDAELQRAVNRMNLERTYKSMTFSESGKNYVSDILSGTAAVVGIAGSALGIALSIKQLRGK